ncbi:uncharacterized protein LOC112347552 [Selaginella moellendorffii]|uniref:uncharacterized protein LOC112347552 n=1 Tax=Selaginella moellendorffii TaxID=88036 RepID=UPI000D1C42EE|nr:uncharacterized protein LOC112347552 [Selaginella moellendorffii]|eukprot:XP_024534376.1 uncharacterized protein LOC112347552 [Selaginella moellendorffii]
MPRLQHASLHCRCATDGGFLRGFPVPSIRSAYGFLYYKEGIQSVLPDAEVIMDAVHRYANSKLVFHSCLRLQSQLLRDAKNKEAGREILLKSCVSHFGVSLAQELVVRVEHGVGAF